MRETTVPCPDGCGALIAAPLVNNRRRMTDALSIDDKNERMKSIHRVNGEIAVCPSRRVRGGI